MSEIEEIRNKVSIEEVMAPYVEMRQNGRNFKALCPFHQEKTPSFIISPDKGLAYCFGCRKGGDIFACIQELENVEFPEAVKILAEKAGVELKQRKQSPIKKEEKDQLSKALHQAHQFFQQELSKNSKAQEYLANRGYTKAICDQLKLGFAPDSFHELSNTLKTQSFSPKDLLDSGLASQKEVGDSNVYDRFRNRIIFPIHNPQGKLVAFGGRTLSKDPGAAKYLNSPETELYHKGYTLYCFHLAKQAIREQDQAIVVEGYFDALSAHLKGFSNTVASLGTALTEAQLKLIGRFTNNVLFAFDADTSGQTAASRSIEIAQKLGFNISIIQIPSGKDPDEALHKAPAEWEQAVHEAIPALDYESQKAFATHDSSTIQGKKDIVEHMLPIISRLPNAIEREHYLKKLAIDIGSSLQSLIKEFNKLKSPATDIRPQTIDQEHQDPHTPQALQTPSRIEYLFGLFLNHRDHQETILNQLKPSFLGSETEKKLYKSISDLYNQADKKKKEKSAEKEESPEYGRLQLLELYADEKCQHFTSEEEIEQEISNVLLQIRKDYQKRRLQELRFQMAKDSSETLIKEYQELLKEEF